MRHPHAHEAGLYRQPAWWLVPVVFATAALTAVAIGSASEDNPFAAPMAMAPAQTLTAPCPAQAAEAEPVYQVTEHVQAF